MEKESKENINRIEKLYAIVLKEIREIGIPVSKNINVPIQINCRAKTRFGCCKKLKRGYQESFEIEISNRLFECEDQGIKQTLIHELLHTCSQCGNHGQQWKAYAEKMNRYYGYQIKRTQTAEQLGLQELKRAQSQDTYILVCKDCGQKISRSRRSNVIKFPQKYRCKCGGNLERIK